MLEARRRRTSTLDDPFDAPFDVVIPWVDFADPGYCAAFGRPPPPSPRGFTELKYLLRSLEQHGWWDVIRDVVIVHSDLHPPPPWLTAHPRLRVLRHSSFAPAEALPLRSLEEITAWLHRIEGLTPWFLLSEDDDLVCGPPGLYRRFAWRANRFTLYSSYNVIDDTVRQAGSSWERGAAEADRVLGEAFGVVPRYLDLHTPHLLHLPTVQELAARWPRASGGGRAAFNLVVLHHEYLLATGRAVREPYESVLVDRWSFTDEVHTNHPDFHPPVSPVKALRLCLRLHRAERRSLFMNVQGPGISAEYDDRDARAWGTIADAWLARAFPRPSRFELPPSDR